MLNDYIKIILSPLTVFLCSCIFLTFLTELTLWINFFNRQNAVRGHGWQGKGPDPRGTLEHHLHYRVAPISAGYWLPPVEGSGASQGCASLGEVASLSPVQFLREGCVVVSLLKQLGSGRIRDNGDVGGALATSITFSECTWRSPWLLTGPKGCGTQFCN